MNFAGYLNLQKDHLLDLGSSAKLEASQAAPLINEIKGQLDSAKAAYEESIATNRGILNHQDDVTEMVNRETERLEHKKESIDTALEGQKRMIQLNESYRMRYRYYLRIVVTVLVVTVLFIVIKLVATRLPGIPGSVWDLLLILIFAISGFYIYFTIMDIRRRDQMNFNKLYFTPPSSKKAAAYTSITQKSKGKAEKTTLYDSITGANGQAGCETNDCCPAPMYYDSNLNYCVYPTGT